MQSFKNFLDKKFQDPNFKNLYDNQCNVCSFSASLVAKLSRLPYFQSALLLGQIMDQATLDAFVDGDYCDYTIIKTICEFFDYPLPKDCRLKKISPPKSEET